MLCIIAFCIIRIILKRLFLHFMTVISNAITGSFVCSQTGQQVSNNLGLITVASGCKTIPNGTNSWTRLCPLKVAPADDNCYDSHRQTTEVFYVVVNNSILVDEKSSMSFPVQF